VVVLIMDPALVHPTSAFGVAVVATIAGSLVLGGLYALLSIGVWRQRRALGLERVHVLRIVAAVAALLSVGAIIWAIGLGSFWSILVGIVIIAIDVALIAVLRRNPGSPVSSPSTLAWRRLTMAQAVNGGVGTVVAMIVPAMATISVVIILVVIATGFVPVVASTDVLGHVESGFDLVALVRDIYLTQARVFLISFVSAAVGVGLPSLTISGIMMLTRRSLA
jgi:hypothetical protein